MSKPVCGACDELRETSADFVVNGITTDICDSLHQNTGLNPNLAVLHDDEEDLHNINDCLVGRKVDEIEAFEICDWKTFTKQFVQNLYETLKAIICSLGGAWDKINCLLNNVGGNRMIPQVMYARSTTIADKDNFFERPWEVQDIDLPGIEAPHDGVFIINCCADAEGFFGRVSEIITFYASDETWSSQMEVERAQHYDVGQGFSASNAIFATTVSSAIKVNKGAHLKIKVNPYNMSSDVNGWFRIHQICVTFMPTFELDVEC